MNSRFPSIDNTVDQENFVVKKFRKDFYEIKMHICHIIMHVPHFCYGRRQITSATIAFALTVVPFYVIRFPLGFPICLVHNVSLSLIQDVFNAVIVTG